MFTGDPYHPTYNHSSINIHVFKLTALRSELSSLPLWSVNCRLFWVLSERKGAEIRSFQLPGTHSFFEKLWWTNKQCLESPEAESEATKPCSTSTVLRKLRVWSSIPHVQAKWWVTETVKTTAKWFLKFPGLLIKDNKKKIVNETFFKFFIRTKNVWAFARNRKFHNWFLELSVIPLTILAGVIQWFAHHTQLQLIGLDSSRFSCLPGNKQTLEGPE